MLCELNRHQSTDATARTRDEDMVAIEAFLWQPALGFTDVVKSPEY